MPELKPSVLGYYDVFFLLKFLTFQYNKKLADFSMVNGTDLTVIICNINGG